MIKVICIKDSILDPSVVNMEELARDAIKYECTPSDLYPKYGKEYTVIKVKHGKTLYGTNNDIWYTLKETGNYVQHSSLFVISPDFIRESKLDELLNE
jgi:hypothetical protein